MTALVFRDDGSGNLELLDRVFEQCQFADLTISPPIGNTILIRNTKFLDCTISPGTCAIASGVTLDGVVFSNLDCGDALRISSEVTLREVVVVGQKPQALIVQPEADTGFVMPLLEQVDYQLDIAGFGGNVVIIGVQGNMVRKNADHQVTVRASWKDDVDWKGLGIGPFSYWRIFIKKLTAFGADEGVFSVPNPFDKHFEETMREKELLERAGLCFD